MFSRTRIIARATPKSCSKSVSLRRTQQTASRSLVVQATSLQRHASQQQHITTARDNQQLSYHPSSTAHSFSSWTGRGHDLFSDSFLMGDRPKVLLEAIGPSGFDVSNLLKKIDPNEVAPHGALHMLGSILVFPNACFLWKIEEASDITIESLAPVILHRPKIEFLFLGTAKPMPQAQLMTLKKALREQADIVVERLPLSEAMATFNILNGEDRMVATALVLDKDESHYPKDNLVDLS